MPTQVMDRYEKIATGIRECLPMVSALASIRQLDWFNDEELRHQRQEVVLNIGSHVDIICTHMLEDFSLNISDRASVSNEIDRLFGLPPNSIDVTNADELRGLKVVAAVPFVVIRACISHFKIPLDITKMPSFDLLMTRYKEVLWP